MSRFIWSRRFEVGNNSADMNRLLERLECLQKIGVNADCLADIAPHRITQLRRRGERYLTDGLQDISGDRRHAILAVCAVEWRSAIADTVEKPMTGSWERLGARRNAFATSRSPMQEHPYRTLYRHFSLWVRP
ncbi:hypothetical protein SAMN04488117_110109 [Celeribacter baekdonensis]|uniref:Uncharacterized protein n=1 Tax=Celeribacter baekdonensis TaxID=875171 RepID=A0A1G7QWZ7_9RHOB|nr:hypothetical protein SAMN04488117_110109 [Celeribacter baekdonensis]